MAESGRELSLSQLTQRGRLTCFSHRSENMNTKAGKTPCMLLALGALASCATTPPHPAPLDAVRAKFDAVNRHDLRAVVESYAPQARLMASDFCAPRIGRSEVERTYTALFSINDLSVRLDHVLADGNHVAVRFRVLGSIGGQRFEVPIADFFEVRDGLIVYDLGVFDNAGRPCRP
jgi:ketosteroid isomerase-like protein